MSRNCVCTVQPPGQQEKKHCTTLLSHPTWLMEKKVRSAQRVGVGHSQGIGTSKRNKKQKIHYGFKKCGAGQKLWVQKIPRGGGGLGVGGNEGRRESRERGQSGQFRDIVGKNSLVRSRRRDNGSGIGINLVAARIEGLEGNAKRFQNTNDLKNNKDLEKKGRRRLRELLKISGTP